MKYFDNAPNNNILSNNNNNITIQFTSSTDPRTNDWFLIKSPVPIFSIVALYLYFVLFWGPHYMRDRKPFKLEKTLIVYNFIQIFVSAWLVYEVSVTKYLKYSVDFLLIFLHLFEIKTKNSFIYFILT